MDGNAIKVVCRFRPQNSIELGQNGQIVVRLDDEVTDEGDVATLHLEVCPFFFSYEEEKQATQASGTDR